MPEPAAALGPGEGRLPALSDLSPEGMVHVAQVRAPTPRGRLLAINAKQLPRAYRMITVRDILGQNSLPGLGIRAPVLVDDRISWRGEPVALIAGPDPSLVAELAASIDLEWEEEEAVLDADAAGPERVLARRSLLRGDPEGAFSRAASVVSGDYRSSPLEHYYSEPQGALASFDYDRLVIRTATQWPTHVRDSVATVLGSQAGEIRVLSTRLGVHLDGKLWYPSLLACHAALAAKACKAPARILFTREEDFRFSPKGARSLLSLRGALDANGRLAALEAHLVIDMGAYGPFSEEMLVEAGVALLGLYDCPNLRFEARAIATDTPPAGAFAGLGAAHAFYAIESLMSRLAEEVAEDPIEWKTRSLLAKSAVWATGERIRDEAPLGEIGARLSSASDFPRKHASYELVRKRRTNRHDGPLRGIGVAFAFQADGTSPTEKASDSYALEAILGKDLRLSVATGSGSPHGGVSEIWRSEAARILALPPGSIDILPPDTDVIGQCGPETRSRGLALTGRLATRAFTAIQKKRFREALPISARTLGRVERGVTWTETLFEGLPFHNAAWAGAVVEVELDPWTLVARPTGLWLCLDGGLIMSPERAARAIRAASIDALGATACESIALVDGGIEAEAYFSYSLRAPRDLPPISLEFLDPGRGAQPKGIGDLPFHVIPAAFLSAASQAAGYPLSSLPAVIDRAPPEWEQP